MKEKNQIKKFQVIDLGKRIMVTSLLTLCLLSSTMSNVYASELTSEKASKDFKAVMENILDEYRGVGEVDEQKLFDAAMKGMFSILDPYSEYFTEDEFATYIQAEEGYFYGIGAEISTRYERPEITNVYKDSPAEKAGIQNGDILMEVDGTDVTNMNATEISQLVRGENETKVSLKINRAGNYLIIDVIRGKIEENPISASLLSEIVEGGDDKTAYICIDTFNLNTVNNLIDTLNEYLDKNAENLIIDLRGNTGGYFVQALQVAGLFINKGEIITTMIETDGTESTYLSNADSLFNKIIILVDKNSASASELVTAAIQENDHCIVIGENTYGKSVAQVFKNIGDVNYKLTTKEYLTPLRNSVKGIGVTPDIIYETPDYIYDIKYKYYPGDTNDEITHVKKILNYLGYTTGELNSYYDDITCQTVMNFQTDCGVGSYGGIDYTTQRWLNTALYNKINEKDIVLEKAIEVMKNYDEEVKKYVSKK